MMNREMMAQVMAQQPQRVAATNPRSQVNIMQAMAPMMQAMLKKKMMGPQGQPGGVQPSPYDAQIGFNPTVAQFNRGF